MGKQKMEVMQNCDPQDSTTNLHFEHIQEQQVKLDCGFFDSAFQILLSIIQILVNLAHTPAQTKEKH